MERTQWFALVCERYEANMKTLYEGYPDSWHGFEAFEPLKLTCETMLNAGGMFYVLLEDGGYYIGLNRSTV